MASWTASLERGEMSGFGDPRFRFSVNLFGAPALSVKEFANYQQDLIIGVSLQVSAPLGQYDNSKLLNLGNNRWSFRPELGISKAWGPWTVEVAPSVTFFTDNTDFFNGSTFAQAPIYLVQGHIIYNFKSGAWMSLDGTYFTGGRTTLNGVRGDNEQANTRAGLTVALPVDRYNSIKLNASTGIIDPHRQRVQHLWYRLAVSLGCGILILMKRLSSSEQHALERRSHAIPQQKDVNTPILKYTEV